MLSQNLSTNFKETSNPELAEFLLCIFSLFMSILMLNLLIALMGESFSKIADKKLPQWRREQASIIADQAFSLSAHRLSKLQKPCIHLLRYVITLPL